MPSFFPAVTYVLHRVCFLLALLWLVCGWQIPAYATESLVTTNTSSTDQAKSTEANAEADPKEEAQSKLEDSMDAVKAIEKTLSSLRKEISSSKKGAVLNRATIKDSLDLISQQLKEAYSGIDGLRNTTSNQGIQLEKLKTEINHLTQEIHANAADINSQKFLVENYAAGGYETLLRMADIDTKLSKLSQGQTLQNDQKQDQRISMIKDLNRLWLLLAIVLVSFTPLAFVLVNKQGAKTLLDGTPQEHGVLLVCVASALGYFVMGFGLMFGHSASGWFGTSNYLGLEPANSNALFAFADFFLYQLGFILLTALIIYTAIGKSLSATGHLLLAAFIGAILVPVFGHWLWSGRYITDNKGWLESIGFIDMGGASLHAMVAWVGAILVWKMGTRKTLQQTVDANDGILYPASAALVLWLSALGLTTGMLSISTDQIATTMLNISVAASAAGFAAFVQQSWQNKPQHQHAIAGFVTGLVAVSASAPLLDPVEALCIGIISGLLHNACFKQLRQYVLPQAWQKRLAYLISIHGFGGIWGCLAAALWASEGAFVKPDFAQLLPQLTGIAILLIYSLVMAHVAFFMLSFSTKDMRLVNATTKR